MRRARAFSFGLFWCLCSAALDRAAAQVSVYGELQGSFYDRISGARIELSRASELFAETTSGAQGSYSLNVAPDVYDLTIHPAPDSSFGLFSGYSLALDTDTELVVAFGQGNHRQTSAVKAQIAAAPEQAQTTSPLSAAELVAYAGRIVDRSGAAMGGMQILLFSDAVYSTHADADGAFEVSGAPLLSTVAAECGDLELCPSDPDHSRSMFVSFPQVDLSCGPLRDQLLKIENRTLSGVVKEGCGGPLAGVTVSWSQRIAYGNGVTGSITDHVLTDDQGRFALTVVPGSGTLTVGFAGRNDYTRVTKFLIVADHAADPKTHEIELWPVPSVEMVKSTGRVVDSQGRGIPYARVRLGGRDYSDFTDESGAFEIVSPKGNSTFELFYCGQPTCWGDIDALQLNLSWRAGAFGVAPFDDVQLVVDTRTLSFTVVDSDGVLLPEPRLSWSQTLLSLEDRQPEGSFSQFIWTDGGKSTIQAIVGPVMGNLNVYVDDGTGTDSSYTALQNEHTVSGDFSYLIVLPIASDQSTAELAAGESVTTAASDGSATPSDPIETTLRSPNAGSASIHERPLTAQAPAGFHYLTQEIELTAPSANTDNPLIVQFRLDATRLHENQSAEQLTVFREGQQVLPCDTTADPCFRERKLLDDGDVELTVQTTRPGVWNIGLPERASALQSRTTFSDSLSRDLPVYQRTRAQADDTVTVAAINPSLGCSAAPTMTTMTPKIPVWLLLATLGSGSLARLAKRARERAKR